MSYIHLISSASGDMFPANTNGSFTTMLSTPIGLEDDEYEAAICELHIPNSIDNLPNIEDRTIELVSYQYVDTVGSVAHSSFEQGKLYLSQYNIKVNFNYHMQALEFQIPRKLHLEYTASDTKIATLLYGDDDRIIHVPLKTVHKEPPSFNELTKVMRCTYTTKSLLLPLSHYDTLPELVEAINTLTGETQFLTLDENNKSVKCQSTYKVVHFSETLSDGLGYRQYSCQGEDRVSRFLPDLTSRINCIFVYADFIENTRVGNTLSPVLRIVPYVRANRNEVVSYIFNALQFKRIVQRELSCITVYLRSDTGEKIAFNGQGRVALTLVIRKIKNDG